MQIYEALDWAKSLGIGVFDRQVIMLHCLGQPTHNKAFLISHDQDILTQPQIADYKALIHRCQRGEPVAYLTGYKEFYGLEFKVTPATLIPRPDTETLVQWAIETVDAKKHEAVNILDLGTGSGCIAISLKHARPTAQVWATDLSPQALEVAKVNAGAHTQADTPNIHFRLGSWFEALEPGENQLKFDLIVSNPPYIAEHDPHLAALQFEPYSALVAGDSGLSAYTQILRSALKYLRPEGWILFEHGYNQGQEIHRLFEQFGFESIQSRNDLAGICRCTGGRGPKNGIIGP